MKESAKLTAMHEPNLHPEYTSAHEPVWNAYRDNFPRHLISISRFIQSQIMHKLTRDFGHRELRLSFEPFISLVDENGCRLSALANQLQISKQACSQSANLLETVGYIERDDDPIDKRAKIVRLTAQGQRLRIDGYTAAKEVETDLAALLSNEKFSAFSVAAADLYRKLELPSIKFNRLPDDRGVILAGTLPRISDYMMRSLMEITMASGHPGLKMSHGQVLMFIGPDGGRIHQIAKIQEVSKQAISAIANDLEQLGYVYRTADPQDARQLLLNFTAAGWQLIKDSVASVETLETELQSLSGDKKLQRLKAIARELYHALRLEADVLGDITDIHILARQLKKQLGKRQSKALGKLLLGD